jgi:RND superfamily putative drug exporter
VERVKSGLPSRLFARLVGLLGVLILAALVAAAYGAWRYLPGVSSLPDSGVRALLPADTPAARAELVAGRLFGSSLLPRIAVVQRNPAGLPAVQQRRIVQTALRLDEGRLHVFPRGSRALPYLNTARLLPGARERSTTAITYLGFPTSVAPQEQRNYADQYAGAVALPGAQAEATGFIPGQIAQSEAIDHGLIWVEVASVLAVAIIVGLYLRSLLAPLVMLAAAGIAYLISIGVVSYLAQKQGLQLQNQIEPIIVVLLLGVVTDYSVFFLSGMRARLRAGEPPPTAARRATAQVVPIIFTAGLLVAAGLATLRLASIGFVQTLGPAMAIVVLISLGVAISFVPAAMRIIGRPLFWPGLRETEAAEPLLSRIGAACRRGVARGTSLRLIAYPTLLVVIAGLVFAIFGLAGTHLALTPISGLPATSPPARAALQAERGFTAGIIAPTELVIQARGISSQQGSLRRLGQTLDAQPEIGAVIGAGLTPLPGKDQTAFRSRSGDAVRYYVAFRHDPYSSAAISDLNHLQQAMPHLLANAHLARAAVLYAGDTALAKETTSRVYHDLLWVGLAAATVNLLLLALFLRSLIAPLLLVASSALAICATLGLTSIIFQHLFHTTDLTYFVPLAVGVLLLSFGTDYNLFIVGRIWQETQDQSTARAIRAAVPKASRAISIAGLALAASFSTLAIIPIAPFREFAVTIALGVLIDTFIIRTVLIPALLTALGNKTWWPSRRGQTKAHTPIPTPPGPTARERVQRAPIRR